MEKLTLNICDCISEVYDEIKESKFNLDKLSDKAKEHISRVASFYKVDEKEAVILILAIETHYTLTDENDYVSFQEITNTANCNAMKIIPYKNQILSLINKNYFFRNYALDENLAFRINGQVLDSLYKDSFEGISDVGEDFNDRYAFIRRFKKMYESSSHHTSSYKLNILSEFEKTFSNIEFVKKMMDIIPMKDERFIVYDICGDFVDGVESGLLATLFDIYSDNTAKRVAKAMADGDSFLIENDFLTIKKNESVSDSVVALTEKTKELFLGEDLCLYERKFSNREMINPEKINEIKLFYSTENQKQIDTLKKYLEPEHFSNIQKNLKDRGMKTGFAVLLHGAPGTGKTETVYQIAKQTNRNIVKVDVAKSKSCWFGESEKLVKEIFERYKSVCKKAVNCGENIPILLFNEADAIFSKRKDVNSGSVAQTENAIQNIILDEMENLEGILIATTNLTDNFDSAFERRFLYKICFDSPDEKSRALIWESRISSLPEDTIRKLASYELSGGQIDNIIRKATMQEILSNEKPSFENLREFCSEENLLRATDSHKIGFSV